MAYPRLNPNRTLYSFMAEVPVCGDATLHDTAVAQVFPHSLSRS